MEIFIGIIVIFVSILYIVLFFKVWGMTNDVKEIKKAMCVVEIDEITLIKKSLCGEKEQVEKILVNRILEKYIDLCYSITVGKKADGTIYAYDLSKCISCDEYYTMRINKILEEHTPEFAKYGLSIPENIKELKYREIKY